MKRELEILEAKIEPDDLSSTLYALGPCVQDEGWPGEAQAFLRRELGICKWGWSRTTCPLPARCGPWDRAFKTRAGRERAKLVQARAGDQEIEHGAQ